MKKLQKYVALAFFPCVFSPVMAGNSLQSICSASSYNYHSQVTVDAVAWTDGWPSCKANTAVCGTSVNKQNSLQIRVGGIYYGRNYSGKSSDDTTAYMGRVAELAYLYRKTVNICESAGLVHGIEWAN